MDKSKILVVNDSETQRKMYVDLLVNEGLSVFEAVDGQDGLRKVNTENPDVIVTDLSMPNMDGFAMIERLKSDQENKYIPVICVSATFQDIKTKLHTLLEVGAEEYFYLEDDPSELVAKVHVMLRIRKIYLELLDKNHKLKQFNDIAVGRELKMTQLKDRIKQLEEELKKYANK